MIDLNCEIINVGTELLLGDILNTDAEYLSQQLSALGLDVLYESVVGDNPARLREQLKVSSQRSDILIISGGLGPTPDDLTKEVVCEFFDRELVLDESSLNVIKSFFSAKGVDMPENNIKQAMLPSGCTVFKNLNGTAPGFGFKSGKNHVLVFPGPPSELKLMFETSGKKYLAPFSDGILVSHFIRTFGIGESSLALKISEFLDSSNPTVATYAKQGESYVRVTAKADDFESSEMLCMKTVTDICDILGSLVYGVDCPSIEHCVVNLLREKNLKISTAESCTGGLLSKRLTDVPGSSYVFECGFVTYSSAIKNKLLGVSDESLSEFGAVSKSVAEEMAIQALEKSGSDISVSVTGISGPDSDSSGIEPGVSYIGIAYRNSVRSFLLNTGRNDREYNRTVNVSNALNYVRLLVDSI